VLFRSASGIGGYVSPFDEEGHWEDIIEMRNIVPGRTRYVESPGVPSI
jgi:hypothetical protein